MSAPRAIWLSANAPADDDLDELDELAHEATAAAGDIDAALELTQLTEHWPLPGSGCTLELWQRLATVAAADLTVARVIEPHLDARAILAECAEPPSRPPSTRWGVFAAEGPGMRLEATRDAGAWTLRGTKPWCSLAGRLTHALVTAWSSPSERTLYAVALQDERVHATTDGWVARGLPDVVSSAVTFDGVPVEPVGAPGWYLERPGFAWGGIGVAAIWYGGTVGVARRVLAQAGRRQPDQIGEAILGSIDTTLAAAAAVLARAATVVDSATVCADDAAALALRCRHVVARAAREILQLADEALGPAPLAHEEEHARRVADLHLYIRQEHGPRDLAALGRNLADADRHGRSPW